MAYELIAARSDLSQIVARTRSGHDEADVRTLRGWRRELVGNELLELLAGHRALTVGGDWRLTITDA
jgi:ribonuclease D